MTVTRSTMATRKKGKTLKGQKRTRKTAKKTRAWPMSPTTPPPVKVASTWKAPTTKAVMVDGLDDYR